MAMEASRQHRGHGNAVVSLWALFLLWLTSNTYIAIRVYYDHVLYECVVRRRVTPVQDRIPPSNALRRRAP